MCGDKNERWKVRILHIQDASEKITEYVKGLEFDEFEESDMTIDAVIRNFQIIGDAVKSLPTDVREHYSDIPWREMAGFRDVIVHNYDGIDITYVWDVAQKDIPDLLQKLKNIPVKPEDFK